MQDITPYEDTAKVAEYQSRTQQPKISLNSIITGWLHAKKMRTGSERTKPIYEDYIKNFRALLISQGLDLDSPNIATIATIAQGWSAIGKTGKPLAGASINQRLAAISSFYNYAMKKQRDMERPIKENPILTIDRAQVQAYANSRALDAEHVEESVEAIDTSTLAGKRDYAMIGILLTLGRRANELLSLKWGNIEFMGKKTFVTFTHAKGGKSLRDQLEPDIAEALIDYLNTLHKGDLFNLPKDTPLFVSLSHNSYGNDLSLVSLSAICEKYLGESRIHALRHTFAHEMQEAGASVTDIQQRLAHSSLATTGIYLNKLASAENKHAHKLVTRFGLSRKKNKKEKQ